MGKLTFIKDGVATTIGVDGEVSKSTAIQCDSCYQWSDGLGGRAYNDIAGDVLLWLCLECRR